MVALAFVVGVGGCVEFGTEVDAYFCPEDDCMKVILEELGKAEESIHCAIYVVTLEEFAEMLAMKSLEPGVDVKLVVEKNYVGSKYAKYGYLRELGVDVRLDGNDGDMHNKFCVIDGKTVITGSANWSGNGMWRNNENVLVVRDKGVAEKYDAEFRNLWESEGLYR